MTTIIGVTEVNKVRDLLEQRGKTPYWLARQANLPDRTVYALVERDPFRIDEATYGVVRKVARALGVDPEELRSDDEERD